jgi:tetratricopeptide (TPR) repeat protein
MNRTMKRWPTRRAVLVLIAAVVATAGTGWRIVAQHAAARSSAAAVVAAADAAAEVEVRTKDIAFYETRAARDPESAGDRAQLAALYFQRARETSDFHDYVRAEESARSALALRTQHNGAAFAVLASTLLAQHRFVEAREFARRLVASDPDVDAFRAMLGETCLELGDYAGAQEAFASIRGQRRAALAVAPRLARWAEIRGDTAQARNLLRWARARADSAAELPREQRAWFHLRLGELDLRQGRPGRAEREFRAGLAVLPNDHRLLAAMARLAAGRHEWRDAIRYGDSSVAITLDPATLGIVADAYAALGDTAKAAEYVRTMEVAVGQQPGAYHRAWSLFLLDHDRQGTQVLEAAEAELAARRDIYGYDLLAWALYKQGRPLEARRAMANALAQGTQDAMLFFHAGMIERAAGNAAAARDFLSRALAVAPAFDPSAASIAQAVIDTLARAAGMSSRAAGTHAVAGARAVGG